MIITPYLNLKQKPPRGWKINRNHPLARGLKAYWLFNEYDGLPYEGITKAIATNNEGFVWGGGGYYNDSDTNDVYLLSGSYPISILDNPPYTITIYGAFDEIAGAPTTASAQMVKWSADGAKGFHFGACGWNANTVTFTKSGVIDVSTSILQSSALRCYTAIVHADFKVTVIAGQEYHVGTGTHAINDDAGTGILYAGEGAWGNESATGTWHAVYIWHEAKILEEMLTFHREPYAMFQPEDNAIELLFLGEGVLTGTVCWGHSTGVTEDNTRTFVIDWTGTGSISGSGDAEIVTLDYLTSEYVESITWQIGSGTVVLDDDKYGSNTRGKRTIKYKTGTDETDCNNDTWHTYSSPINMGSDTWMKIRVEAA